MSPQSHSSSIRRHHHQDELFSPEEVRAFARSAGATLIMLVFNSIICLYVVIFGVFLLLGGEMSIRSPAYVYERSIAALFGTVASVLIAIVYFVGKWRYSSRQCHYFHKPAMIQPVTRNGQREAHVHIRMTANMQEHLISCFKDIGRVVSEEMQKKTPVIVLSSHLLSSERERKLVLKQLRKNGIPEGWQIISDNKVFPTPRYDCGVISLIHSLRRSHKPLSLRRESATIRICRADPILP